MEEKETGQKVKLTSLELDALKEMGNIGTGNAATSLSKFINKNVDMNFPETKFVHVSKFSETVGGPEKMVVGIYLQISGEVHGEAMFLFPEKGAYELIDLILSKPLGTTKRMDDMDKSAFMELSNILTGSFLNALGNMLEAKILPSVPHVAADMAQTLLDFILIKISKCADTLLYVKTGVNVEGHKIDGEFTVLFDQDSLKKIISKMHDKYGLESPGA
ncbi:chemotaxis protein CheC [Candidatus Woesearchaeota archaeon]|nr:chemotaxis protein CheC [Candidatus Woesearchaeota archaeon]